MNIIIRYSHERFEEYFLKIKSNEIFLNYLFNIIEKENEKNNKNVLIKEIIYSLFKIIKTKEQLKILLNQCYDISTFMIVNINNYDLINTILANYNKITVIKYINPHTLSINKDDYNSFIQNFRKLLEKEYISKNQNYDFDDVI